mgnify:CR=1 FL=1|tara:strand:+ start:744 stop:953 length:210 start_codon:yes stop_codon:yes gene_type:complete
MNDQEFEELKADLQEIKEMMRNPDEIMEMLKVISKTVAADKEIAAQRTLRKLEESRISKQIRQMSEMAD